jgi:hypothetical protein
MERRVFLAALVVAILLIPVLAFAQAGNFDLRYEPRSVQTLTGTVITTIDYNPARPSAGPQSVIVSSGGQYFTVFLGPGWFLNQMGLRFAPGDLITCTASQRNIMGRNYLVASRIIRGNQTFDLRSSSGTPLWTSSTSSTLGPPIGSGPSALALQFDPDRIDSVNGRIISTSTIMTNESPVPYVVALVNPSGLNTREVRVILGPVDLISQNGIDLSRGRHVSVQGSNVRMNGVRYLIATNLSQGTNFITLRTLAGAPLFSVNHMGTSYIGTPPDANF